MIRCAAVIVAVSVMGIAASASAQDMKGMDMSGMSMPMPAKKPAAKKVPARKPAVPVSRSTPTRAKTPGTAAPMNAMPGMDMTAEHSGLDMSSMPDSAPADATATSSMPGMDMSGDHSGHNASTMPGMAMPGMQPTGTALPAGNAPAPMAPMDHYADRQFPPAEMQLARSAMMRESGGQSFHQVFFNLAEFQARKGENGYRWDGEAWFGADINRLTLKTEGEGGVRSGIDSAEVQALYSHAIGPYFNLQAGVRHDFQPSPTRTYATIGFQGLAPYMFEVGGAVFLSNKGDVLARLEGYYDQRITQRLILQPRAELNFSAQDVPENRYGAGLVNAELGLRLRYEIARQFAPYIGISYDAKTGRSADFARADGKDPTTTAFVAGVHFWF
jgi:copper resistance protein B